MNTSQLLVSLVIATLTGSAQADGLTRGVGSGIAGVIPESKNEARQHICLPKGSIEIFGAAPRGFSFSKNMKPQTPKYRFVPEYNYGSSLLLRKALSPEGMRGQVGDMYHSLPFDFENGYIPGTNTHDRSVGTGLTYSQEYASIKYRGTTYVFSGDVADIPSGVSKIETTEQHCYIDFAYLQMLRKIFLADSCQKANANFASQKPYAEQVCGKKESLIIHWLEAASVNLEKIALATLMLLFLAMVIASNFIPQNKK